MDRLLISDFTFCLFIAIKRLSSAIVYFTRANATYIFILPHETYGGPSSQ